MKFPNTWNRKLFHEEFIYISTYPFITSYLSHPKDKIFFPGEKRFDIISWGFLKFPQIEISNVFWAPDGLPWSKSADDWGKKEKKAR